MDQENFAAPPGKKLHSLMLLQQRTKDARGRKWRDFKLQNRSNKVPNCNGVGLTSDVSGQEDLLTFFILAETLTMFIMD